MGKRLIILVLVMLLFAEVSKAETGIHIMMTDMRLPSFPYEQNLDQMDIIQQMGDRAGVQLHIKVYPHEEYPKKIKLSLSSGQLPDVYHTYSMFDYNFPEAIRSGIAIPLNDYLHQFGPNLLERIPQHVWDSVTIDGVIYGIPEVLLPSPTRRGLYIREDWLDKLGLEVPQTVEDFIEVMEAFRDSPILATEAGAVIPYIGRQHLEWMEVFFGAYGVLPRGWRLRGEQFVPDAITPEFKQALSVLRDLYANQLLDPEFVVNTGAMWEKKIVEGRVGMWEHIGSWLSDWQQAVGAHNPGAKVRIIPAPIGPEGFQGTGKYPPYLRVWFITKAAKSPELVIRFFDWLVSEEGQQLVKYGNGKSTWTAATDPDLPWRSVLLRMVNDGVMDWEFEAKKDPQDAERFKAADLILQNEGITNQGSVMPIPQAIMENPELAIPSGNLFRESIMKIILGIESIDYFDTFVERWLASGGAQAVEQATSWYMINQ